MKQSHSQRPAAARSLLLCAAAVLVTWSAAGTADRPRQPGPAGQWVDISAGVLAKLKAENIKPGWPGKTAGVVVDRASGDVYMIVTGQGVWRSTDKGAGFQRVDGKAVGGRCETGYSLRADPAGRRVACFMLDGRSAMTPDGGKTWRPIKNVNRGYDWAAVDWSQTPAKTMFGLVHESGGIGALSRDGGRTWKQLGKGYFAVGVFPGGVLVCGKEKQKGIWRSADGGASWQKVDDASPIGAMRVFQGAGYWLTAKGVLHSADQGKSWKHLCDAGGAAWGPYFGTNAKHFVVVNRKGFNETTDAGKTWKLIAPYPPSLKGEYNQRGWMANFAWDPIGKVCYVSRMGQATFKFQCK